MGVENEGQGQGHWGHEGRPEGKDVIDGEGDKDVDGKCNV